MKKDLLSHPLISHRRKELEANILRIQAAGFNQNQFCLMPFVNIILEPNGSVGLCRHKGTEHSLGNLNNSSWQEIWNGDMARKWRQEFLDGNPTICKNELAHQKCNLCPQLGKMFPEEPLELAEEMPVPLRLTANFNGLCNLKCIMCDVWQLPNGQYKEENFWIPARESLFPFLKEIDMLSGEPLIQPDTFKLIEEMSTVNPDCLWSITTNAHWKFTPKLRNALDKIKIKNLILSVDSFDDQTYHKIRTPGNLSIVLENIKKLIEYDEDRKSRGLTGLQMNLNFLIQKENWTELSSALHFCLDRDIHPFVTFCYRPLDCSLLNWEVEKRREILTHYVTTMSWDELCLSHRVIAPLVDSLSPLDKAHILDKMKEKKVAYLK